MGREIDKIFVDFDTLSANPCGNIYMKNFESIYHTWYYAKISCCKNDTNEYDNDYGDDTYQVRLPKKCRYNSLMCRLRYGCRNGNGRYRTFRTNIKRYNKKLWSNRRNDDDINYERSTEDEESMHLINRSLAWANMDESYNTFLGFEYYTPLEKKRSTVVINYPTLP